MVGSKFVWYSSTRGCPLLGLKRFSIFGQIPVLWGEGLSGRALTSYELLLVLGGQYRCTVRQNVGLTQDSPGGKFSRDRCSIWKVTLVTPVMDWTTSEDDPLNSTCFFLMHSSFDRS